VEDPQREQRYQQRNDEGERVRVDRQSGGF
jgi:hypothetical protein